MTAQVDSIEFGRERIRYRITESDRTTLAIEVHPDRCVEVKAPRETDPKQVRERVRRRAGWILRQQDFFLSYEPRTPVRYYISGETHSYLGRRYRLKWRLASTEGVKLSGKYLLVSMPQNQTAEHARSLVDKWLRMRALDIFPKRVTVCWAPFERWGLEVPPLTVRWMTHRWGSLSANGRLTLNTELIRAPRECIDYVITHECCHLLHPDHGAGFWKLLLQVMPDGERRKKKLEEWMA